MAAVFISYAREDKAFVARLHDALKERDRDTWVDWEGIPESVEWMKEIHAAIEGSDTFVFVMSPDSIASDVCGQELSHAVDHQTALLRCGISRSENSLRICSRRKRSGTGILAMNHTAGHAEYDTTKN